jgi:hypothetical protein
MLNCPASCGRRQKDKNVHGARGPAREGEAAGVMFTARSALALLAESRIGCSESLKRAHGFPSELIAKLVEADFTTAISSRARKLPGTHFSRSLRGALVMQRLLVLLSRVCMI